MDSFNSHDMAGSLQISSDVIEKIARHAALEVDGVCGVVPMVSGARSLVGMIVPPKPISVTLKNDVADIQVSISVKYGTKIPELSERVQQSVKDAVQNMTSISVAKVDLVVAGLHSEPAAAEA